MKVPKLDRLIIPSLVIFFFPYGQTYTQSPQTETKPFSSISLKYRSQAAASNRASLGSSGEKDFPVNA